MVEESERRKRKRELIYGTAVALFREQGFDETTMRDIASAAGISLGSAYHYYRSKDEIVFDFYQRSQDAHEEAVREKLGNASSLKERLRVVLHAKIDTVKDDENLLRAITRTLADASSPLSIFSLESRPIVQRAVAQFDATLEEESLPPERRELIALGLWALHVLTMAFMLFDTSKEKVRTHNVIDELCGTLAFAIPFAKGPFGELVVGRFQQLLSAGEIDLSAWLKA